MNNKHISEEKRNDPVKLAITGGVGSGKTLVCERFRQLGVPVYSADDFARQAVDPGTSAHGEIVSYLGADILMPDKTLDRSKLRRMITQDPAVKKKLEDLIHPEVMNRMKEKIEAARQAGDPMVGVEVPLLFEAGMEGYFDYVVTVSVSQERRIRRIMARDEVSREDAEALMKIQIPEEEKCKRSDFVIDNNGSLIDTCRAVDRLYMQLAGKSEKKE